MKREHQDHRVASEPEVQSDAASTSSSSSSSGSSCNTGQTFVKTVGLRTLVLDSPSARVAQEMGRPQGAQERKLAQAEESQEMGDNKRPPGSPSSLASSATGSGSGTASYKRYKFGLTNHFLTMPDNGEQQQARVYQRQLLRDRANGKLKRARERQRDLNRSHLAGGHGDGDAASNGREQAQRRRARAQSHGERAPADEACGLQYQQADSDCDLSVLAPSSPGADSLLSHDSAWLPLEQANASGGRSSDALGAAAPSSALKLRQHLETNSPTGAHLDRDLTTAAGAALGRARGAHEPSRLLPAGDAGLDAGRCNSKASQESRQRASHLQHLNHHASANESTGNPPADCWSEPLNADAYLAHHAGYAPPSPQASRMHQEEGEEEEEGEHRMRKKLKLSGDPQHDDCASNGLLVRLSSIMYATFLVILGCILHVSELRQKSRNSSDHIYTTIVALIGIFWLLFLQGDLQRYKRYASKFILLESIFNDHQRHQQRQQQQQQQQLRPQSGRSGSSGGNSSTGGGAAGLLGFDPSARSTSSSSASLLNERMSMNTEVIFKKTAYKMYQQQAAAAVGPAVARAHQPQPQRQPVAPLSNYKFAVGNPLKYQQHQHQHQLHNLPPPPPPPPPGGCLVDEQRTPRLVPAYKFLHGKMGANFYLKCGMAAFCFGHVIHEGLRFGQQAYFFATSNAHCRDSAALVAHLVTPLYSFYQLFMMFKYSNLVINRHKVLARFGLMHIIGTCVTFWFRTILEEAFEDFVHKMDYFKAQNKPIIRYLDPTSTLGDAPPAAAAAAAAAGLMRPSELAAAAAGAAPTNAGLAHWLGSLASLGAQQAQQVPPLAMVAPGQLATNELAGLQQQQQQHQQQNLTQLVQSTLIALMSSPMSATITPQIVRHLPDSYHCAQNTLLTTKSMNALPYLYPFTIEYNLLIAAIFLSLYFNIGKLGASDSGRELDTQACGCRLAAHYTNTEPQYAISRQPLGSSTSSSGASFIGSHSSVDLVVSPVAAGGVSDSSSSLALVAGARYNHQPHAHAHARHERDTKFAGEYKSNFVVNADCHAANKGLFLGFFVLLVTLVTIVIFFVTINKPSHLQLGIKINLIQEATLTSLILIVTLAGYRQIMRLNQNPFIKNSITTDDVLMLIPLPFFFIHSLLSIRAESATLYSPHHLTLSKSGVGGVGGGVAMQRAGSSHALNAAAASTSDASRALRLDGGNESSPLAAGQRADFMLGLASGLRANASGAQTPANRLPLALNSTLSAGAAAQQDANQQQQQDRPQARKHTAQMDPYKLLTIVLNLAVMLEVLVQTNFIIDGLRRCSESRYLRFKKPGRELITFAIILNITYWIVATFETKSVEQYKTEIDYYGPLPYMFISHTTLPVMLFYRYHSSVCLAEIWNRAYKQPKRR